MNKMAIKISILSLAMFVMGVVIYGVMTISYSNNEIDLREQIEAQQDNSKVTFDNTWKIIKQQAQVTDKGKDAFKEIYAEIMDKRYDGGADAFMLWVHEHNPQFDMSMYENLMRSIEAQRKAFEVEQKALIDLKREHDALLQKFPGSWFIGDREPIEIQLVTSDKTEDTFNTGKENNVDLFGDENDE